MIIEMSTNELRELENASLHDLEVQALYAIFLAKKKKESQ